MVAIIISSVALVLAIAALIISLKRQKVVKETKTIVKEAPVDNPFYFDENYKAYKLDGDLVCNGSVIALGH